MKWQLVTEELERWSNSGHTASFWLRDDDAIEPTVALDRYIALTGEYEIPVLLATIPAGASTTLANRIAGDVRITPAVHGWAHINHAPEGEKKEELGRHRPRGIVLNELENGLQRLAHLFGSRLEPVLVPPWNRIDAGLLPALGAKGYRAISTFGRKPLVDRKLDLAEINTHVDLIDWKGTRGCRDHDALIRDIASELARSRESDLAAVGILTHHLVHDRAADKFLHEMFRLVSRNKNAKWIAIQDQMTR